MRELSVLPFRGSVAVASGLLTAGQLRGPAWRRLVPDVCVAADLELDHRLRCEAALRGVGPVHDAAISGRSAAVVLGVNVMRPTADEMVEVTVPHRRSAASRAREGWPGRR